jgi:hypothetical protein
MKFPSVKEIAANADLKQLGLEQDLQGWHSEDPYFAAIIGEVNPSVIVEVGSWKGASAVNLAKLAPAAAIYCVDTWLGGLDHWLHEETPPNGLCRDDFGSPMLYHQFLLNVTLSGHPEQIHPIQQTSLNGIRLLHLAGLRPQLVYIDGSHQYDDVCADILAAFNLFPGAVIFGDDYGFEPVGRAVRDFAQGLNGEVQIDKNNFWRLPQKRLKVE